MKIIIAGGGLVGTLHAIYMGRRGHEVHLYEARQDVRTEERYSRQSINLALSTRGRAALAAVGLEDEIVSQAIPMHSRAIHELGGRRYNIRYGSADQAILAIDRRRLNECLLDAAEKLPGLHIYFEHKLISCDVDKAAATFTTPNGLVHAQGDVLFGADGAFSSVRRDIMRRTRMDFHQDYLPHAYKELKIPPSPSGEFQLPPNFLQIWPRHSFMMIALPNPDKSFTVTLFMPWESFEAIESEVQLLQFFEEQFPDAIPLIGKDMLIEDFFRNPTSPLLIIKCKPYHAGRAMILGDAAHAMVPFYGQGMNAGFEDVQVFSKILDEHGDIDATLAAYTECRHADAVAICDLALANYVEMRSKVTSWSFLLRKKLDNLLHCLIPSSFIPLYTMVTFTQIPYATVIARARRQDAIVSTGLMGITALTLLLAWSRRADALGLAMRAWAHVAHFAQ